MAKQAVSKDRNQLLVSLKELSTWANIRWALSGVFSGTMLTIGGAATATGGFKGIPYLISAVYPLSIIPFPPALITTLCIISAISGFTFFWSAYHDSLVNACDDILDWLHEKVLAIFGQKANKNKDKPKSSKERLAEHNKTHMINMRSCREKSVDLCLKLSKLKGKIPESQLATLEYRLQYLDKLIEQQELNAENNDDPKQTTQLKDKQNTPFVTKILSFLKHHAINKLKLLIKLFSFGVVATGFMVGIGMNILTNKSALYYLQIVPANAPVVGTLSILCIAFAVIKQSCPQVFNGSRQYHTISSWLFAEISEQEKLLLEINSLASKNESLCEIATQLKDLSEDIKKTKQHDSNCVRIPLAVMRELRKQAGNNTSNDEHYTEPKYMSPEQIIAILRP